MTGFTRTEHKNNFCSWCWELKSLNSRGLDVRCRLPRGFEHLEEKIKSLSGKLFSRGSLHVNLSVNWFSLGQGYMINESLLRDIVSITPSIEEKILDLKSPSVAEIFQIPGIVEVQTRTITQIERKQIVHEMLMTFEFTMERLRKTRAKEGLRIQKILSRDLKKLSALVKKAEIVLKKQPKLLRKKFENCLRDFLVEDEMVLKDRIVQELAVLITKSDIREELDRLIFHTNELHGLIAQTGSVGRKLEFFSQELVRETNTLCSKSSDLNLIQIGLDLKVIIDRFREQVQNIE